MPRHEISSYSLRTTDAAAATVFYDAVLGHHGDAVYPLHAQALARGARPHWLGHVETAEPEVEATSLLASGGQRLGPRPEGGFVLRDPGGALIALGPIAAPSVAGVVWHVLRTRDAELAAETYSRVFGWSLREQIDLGTEGRFRKFAWTDGASSVGAMGGIEDTPTVHPQWLYFFGVTSIETVVATAKARGAHMRSIETLPGDRRCVIGDDPQGAAFGLMER